MKSRGVDSFYSWVVALSCSIMFLVTPWPLRLGSFLYVEMIDRYDTNRKDASLPFAIAFSMRSLSSPFCGYFGDKFGLQQVTLLGCVLCSVGVGFCFFSEEMISIDICLGLIYGSAFGWSSCLVPEIINQHFLKHRTKAYSVAIGLSGVLNFLTPLILEKVIDDYGVSGTFLIMSAIILNSVPAAMLLVKPEEKDTSLSMEYKTKSSLMADKKDSSTVKFACTSNTNFDFAKASSIKSILEFSPSDRSNSTFVANQPTSNFDAPSSSPTSKTKHLEQYEIETNGETVIQVKLQDKSVMSLTDKKLTVENDPDIIESRDKIHAEDNNLDLIENKDKKFVLGIVESRDKKLAEENHLDIFENKINKLKDKANLDFGNCDKKLAKKVDTDSIERKNKKLTKTKYETIDILWNPVFLFITFTQSSHFYIMYTFWTITVDLVRDKNIPHYLEVYFVMALALLDTIGRSVLGFVTDSRYMTAGNLSALCFGLMGMSCVLLVWVSGFPMTMTAICIFGFISGTNLNVLPGIVTGFIEKEKRTMAMASRLILCAPMSFTMSPLIGYFRGTLGTYDGLLYVMAALCASCTIVMVFLPRLKKHMDQAENKDTEIVGSK